LSKHKGVHYEKVRGALSHKEQARKKLLREHNEFTRSYKEQARKKLLREHNEFTRSYKEQACRECYEIH
jgi:chlorite dismutase